MINRFIRNFLNSQHIIRQIQHVQAVHVACLHQCAKNVCPSAVLSGGARTASSGNLFQVTNLAKHVLVFAQDFQGSRFLQQTLESASPTETARLVDALRGHVLTLAQNMNGSHVIRAALKLVDKTSQMSPFLDLINEISSQVIRLSLHKYGNWVIQCVLEHCTEQQKRPVLEQLHDNVLSLVTDKYGCFVIQHAIEHGLPEDRERIVHILKDDIMKYAQDKFASNVILKCLICGTAEQKKALIDNVCDGGPETLQNARQLMADKFGTFVIQKFFEYGTDDQKARLVDALRGHVLTLSLQIYGCRVVQTALKSMDKTSQMEIIEELTPRACVIRCIKDRYGSYVINAIIELIEPQRLQFVVDAILYSPSDSVTSLSTHEYGCRVIQRVLKHCTEQQKRPMLEQLHDNMLTLVTNQYGSFVIQHVVENGLPEDRERIVRSLQENVLSLVTDTYGNFVIRHVKEHGLPEDRERIVRSLQENVLTLVTDEVTSMSTDEYGSRVIRRVLEHCTEQQKRPVLEQILDNVPTLVTDPYGCFVVEHVIKHGLPEDRERIVRSLKGDILKNTYLHFFCSVIEKCLIFGTTEQRNALIDQVCAADGTGKPPLLEMIKHPFANDVVLKMHDFADSAHRDKMMFAIEEHIPALIRLQTQQEQQSLTKRDGRKSNNGLLDN
uniref:PUM-HD domain-containing protein n=1 Tax=Globodera rostochiensis TaxID=31243 RepID=A0A914HU84_GLORO